MLNVIFEINNQLENIRNESEKHSVESDIYRGLLNKEISLLNAKKELLKWV